MTSIRPSSFAPLSSPNKGTSDDREPQDVCWFVYIDRLPGSAAVQLYRHYDNAFGCLHPESKACNQNASRYDREANE